MSFWNFLRSLFCRPVPAPDTHMPSPQNSPFPIPPESCRLILDQEGTGADMDQPGAWQGEDSGVTLPYGYDLGQVAMEEFHHDWGEVANLPSPWIARLSVAVGVSGEATKPLCESLKDIRIGSAQADAVFYQVTVPQEYRRMLAALPGAGKLPSRAQGALVSLGYNRGWDMAGDRRLEMRQIRTLVTELDHGSIALSNALEGIASNILAMRRLWPVGSDLYNRRAAEAKEIIACE